jgi:hypothetical protein
MAETDDSIDGLIAGTDKNLKIDPTTDGLRHLVTQYVPLRKAELELREKLSPITSSARDLQGRIGTYLNEHDINRKYMVVHTADGEEVAAQFKYTPSDPL